MNNIKFIVYLTVNSKNRKIYIGVHKTNIDNFDGYIGCGVYINRPCTYKFSKTPFQFAVNKYGSDSFMRFTLANFENEEDAYNYEKLLVTEEFIKRADVYNVAIGGKEIYVSSQFIPVYMYDLDGIFKQEFKTVNDAGRFLGHTNGSQVSKSIRLGQRCKTFQFSYEKVESMKKFKRNPTIISEEQIKVTKEKLSKKIGRYSQDGELLEKFDSIADCRRAGYNNCHQVILGHRNHCKNFIFKYL